jgi:hypothetical protein
VVHTLGQLTSAERRQLARPIAATHASNLAGRLAMPLRVNSGRRRDPSLGEEERPSIVASVAETVKAGVSVRVGWAPLVTT